MQYKENLKRADCNNIYEDKYQYLRFLLHLSDIEEYGFFLPDLVYITP